MNKKFVSSLLLITGLFFVLFFSVIVNQIKRMDTSPKIKTASSSESAIERISNAPNFSINGKIQKKETIDTFSKNDEIIIDSNPIYGISIDAKIEFKSAAGIVRVILSAEDKDYLVYEAYPKIASANIQIVENICEETCALDGVSASHLKIEAEDAIIELKSLNIIDQYEKLAEDIKSKSIAAYNKGLKEKQDNYKIDKINEKNLTWLADNTSVSALSYEDKKDLFRGYVAENGTLPNTQGFEYYRGGIFDFETSASSANVAAEETEEPSLLPSEWDWRNRHGENWVTSVKDQGWCGSCWAFSAVAATETFVNLYFNQHLDMDLSEQDVLSCSGGGSCDGGWDDWALAYIHRVGIANEECFPYEALDLPCANKCAEPDEKVNIGRLTGIGSGSAKDTIKRFIMENGGVSGWLYYWRHMMQMVGYGTMKEGDIIYFGRSTSKTRTIKANDKYIGETYWIFKNSWGKNWGEEGFCNIFLEGAEFNRAVDVNSPITTLGSYDINCTDNDSDGYCNWGISANKPDTCPDTCGDIKDCDDSNHLLAGFDQNYNCIVVECGDGIDNDGDGKTDYPDDAGCDSLTDLDETNCDDGVCESSESFSLCPEDCKSECDNGLDDDGDGAIDSLDAGCDSPIETDNDETNCSDGVCEGGETSESCIADCPYPECGDGIDNDGDGAIDLADGGCGSLTDEDETNCGDSVCEGGENSNFCPQDCGYNTCSETDETTYPECTLGTTYGELDGVPYSYTDYCINEGILLEYYCITDNLYSSYEYDCSQMDRVCVNGACVSQ